MPQGAPKICAKSGCFALATSRSRCEAHQPKQTHGWSKEYDDNRPNRHARGYGYKWEKASKAFLKANPLCRMCYDAEPRRLRPATLVDHIIPHRGDMVLFWDTDNWQGLCVTCHAVKTGRGE